MHGLASLRQVDWISLVLLSFCLEIPCPWRHPRQCYATRCNLQHQMLVEYQKWIKIIFKLGSTCLQITGNYMEIDMMTGCLWSSSAHLSSYLSHLSSQVFPRFVMMGSRIPTWASKAGWHPNEAPTFQKYTLLEPAHFFATKHEHVVIWWPKNKHFIISRCFAAGTFFGPSFPGGFLIPASISCVDLGLERVGILGPVKNDKWLPWPQRW